MTITLPDATARMLALLLDRLTWDDVRNRAEDKDQCERMLFAAEETRRVIAGPGRSGR